jgi:hypothetical protein
MDCPGEDLVAGFVEGSLDEARHRAVTEHLALCAACRTLVSELARGLPQAAEARNVDTARAAHSPTLPFPPSENDAPPATFRAGEVIADRYEIRRFLAAGGMGEVYEAADRELHARVALKTVLPSAAEDPRMLGRFKREIALARKITHPNICRIFDVGFHAIDGRRIAFLSMEFLEGETLAARLARGRMSASEAWPLVEQMVAGLSAAHAEGVVHRDFKTANVMLVPRPAGARAVITDFGLARSGDEHTASATSTQGLVGTPAYMAPEQVSGLAVTAAADQYALGVVMFEMVTGQWPFVDETAVLTAVRRLHEPAPSPRLHASDLDGRWESAILRCLARAPEDRFPSLQALSAALSPSVEAAAPAPTPPVVLAEPTEAPGAARAPRTAWPWAGVALLFIAAVFALALKTRRAPGDASPAPVVAHTPTTSPPPTPGAPAAIAVPATFALELSTRPADAELYVDEVRVRNPFVVHAADPSAHHVVAKLPGYLPQERTLSFAESGESVLRLVRASPRTEHPRAHGEPATKPPPDPALNHFIMHYPDAPPAK